MATTLSKPLAREVQLGEQTYKVVISAEGVRITRKGARKGADLKWDAVLALGQAGEAPAAPRQARASDLPTPVAADVAKEVRTAVDALTRARTTLANTGALPAGVLMEIEADPIYGRPEARTDWYIEPLLTPHEVAALLRVSQATVGRIGVGSVLIGGERRYRQSELRRYLLNHQSPN
jgi:hypothetical protein